MSAMACPHCGYVNEIDGAKPGQRVECLACDGLFTWRGGGEKRPAINPLMFQAQCRNCDEMNEFSIDDVGQMRPCKACDQMMRVPEFPRAFSGSPAERRQMPRPPASDDVAGQMRYQNELLQAQLAEQRKTTAAIGQILTVLLVVIGSVVLFGPFGLAVLLIIGLVYAHTRFRGNFWWNVLIVGVCLWMLAGLLFTILAR